MSILHPVFKPEEIVDDWSLNEPDRLPNPNNFSDVELRAVRRLTSTSLRVQCLRQFVPKFVLHGLLSLWCSVATL